MTLITRIRNAIAALCTPPDPPDDGAGEELTTEDQPGIKCRWIEVSIRCRSPVNDGENMPSGCDAMCPARLQNESAATHRELENMRFYQ